MSTKEDPEFNIVTQRWNYEDASGQMYEKNPVTNAWVPIIDEDHIKAQQAAYSVPGVDENAEIAVPTSRKRKIQETFTSAPIEEDSNHENNGKVNKKDRAAASKTKETSVYVQNLPLDATEEEVADVFKKGGLILQDTMTGRPKVKLYKDADGRPKGDALIVYFRAESVSLAIQLLDDTSLRGDAQLMSVAKASFEYKKDKPTPSAKEDRGSHVDQAIKQKGSQRAAMLKSKLSDWDDEDVKEVHRANKFDKIVILKGMFSLHELESDPTLLLDLKEDVREECTRLGEVTNVVLYDKEVDGIMSIRFKDQEDAQACIKLMNGRFFAGRQIVAEIFDGKRRYKKSGKHTDDVGEDGEVDQTEEERLANFGSWLEEGQE